LSVEDNWVVLDRRRVVIPSMEVCSTNCKNWDVFQKCRNFLRDRACFSFEAIDPGNDVEIVELIPFTTESLGGAEVGGKITIIPEITSSEEVDAEVEGEEEVEENAGD
jgi:hypothetical protein